MKLLLIIGTGSFIGGILRYILALIIQSKFLSTFPFGTLGVNILGCFAIGLVFALTERTNMSSEWRLFLATGVCGGFTTFSAFSQETFGLLRDGQIWHAASYVIASIVFGVLATMLGYAFLKFI